MGLVHFCCMGLSSSAAQHSSSVPERNQRLEDAQAEDTQSNEQRNCATGRGEGAAWLGLIHPGDERAGAIILMIY